MSTERRKEIKRRRKRRRESLRARAQEAQAAKAKARARAKRLARKSPAKPGAEDPAASEAPTTPAG
jgi:hypothetical protein